ncbi:MAG TPA: hypothetical protein VJS68_01620 [Thermoplasmata archaeon]|nr:hypothetical protein [Thermoplasmata archaeon]
MSRSVAYATEGDSPEELPGLHHLPPRWEPGPIIPSLPYGVAFLAVLIALLGVVLLIGALLVFVHLFAGSFLPPGLNLLNGVDELGAGIVLVLGAVLVAVAKALWALEEWSLYLAVIVLFGGLAYLFFTASITVLFVVLLVVFMYLLTVRHHFY